MQTFVECHSRRKYLFTEWRAVYYTSLISARNLEYFYEYPRIKEKGNHTHGVYKGWCDVINLLVWHFSWLRGRACQKPEHNIPLKLDAQKTINTKLINNYCVPVSVPLSCFPVLLVTEPWKNKFFRFFDFLREHFTWSIFHKDRLRYQTMF